VVQLKVSRGQYTGYTVLANPMDADLDFNGFKARIREIVAPGTPPANSVYFYAKDKAGVSELFYKNDAGTERDLSAAGVAYPLTPDKNARGNVTGTVTIDLSLANAHVQTMTLTGNITFVFSNPPASTKNIQFQLDISQDATGGRTIAWPASVTVIPSINSGPSERTVILCQTSDGGTTYDAFNTSSSASVLNAANKTLSNLTSPTAINQHLLPEDNGIKNLGSSSFSWNQLHLSELRFVTSGTLDATIPEITTSTGNMRVGVATAKLIEMYVNGTLEYEYSATNLDLKSNTVSGLGATITGSTATNILRQDINGWSIEVGTGDTVDFSINSIVQLEISAGATPKILIAGGNALEWNAEGSIVTGTTNINRTSAGLGYNALTGKKHDFSVNNTIMARIDADFLSIEDGNSLRFGIAGTVNTAEVEIRRTTTYLNYHTPTSMFHRWQINGVDKLELDSTNLILGVGVLRYNVSAGGYSGGSYEIVRLSDRINYNVPTSIKHQFEINAVASLAITSSSLDVVPKIDIVTIGSDPATPAAAHMALYTRNEAGLSEFYTKNDLGNVDQISGRSKWRVRRPYSVFPHMATISTIEGQWSTTFTINAPVAWTNTADSGNGAARNWFVTTTNGDVGIIQTAFNCMSRSLDPDFTIKFKINATSLRRFWVGWFASTPMASDAPTIDHFGLRLSTSAGSTNFVLSHADGATQAETSIQATDTSIHTIRLVADNANSRWGFSFDGASITWITTNIPAAADALGFVCQMRDLDAADKDMDFFWVEGSATK